MAKKFIVRIEYQDYSCEIDDAISLLAIAGRMKAVKQTDYSGPYYVQPEHGAWVDSISLQEVLPMPADDADPVVPATADTQVFISMIPGRSADDVQF